MKFKKLSWEQLAKDCFALADQMRGKTFDEIIAISRGGLVQGRILSDCLHLPMSTISMTFYKKLKKLDLPVITQKLPEDIETKQFYLLTEYLIQAKHFKKP